MELDFLLVVFFPTLVLPGEICIVFFRIFCVFRDCLFWSMCMLFLYIHKLLKPLPSSLKHERGREGILLGELCHGDSNWSANPKTPTQVETDGSLKPIFLKLHLGSSSRWYGNVAGVKEGGKCRTWIDWINYKDQQCKKSMWRVWLVAILKICIPRDLHCSIPTSTGERNELSTFPFYSCSSLSFLSPFFNLSVLLFAILDFSSWV